MLEVRGGEIGEVVGADRAQLHGLGGRMLYDGESVNAASAIAVGPDAELADVRPEMGGAVGKGCATTSSDFGPGQANSSR